jgi:hypothetical protein
MKRAYNFIDRTGQKFGKWTVIEQTKKYNRRDPIWLCKCDCGTVREVSGNSLRNGSSSCNCSKINLGRKQWVDADIVAYNSLMANYRCGAKDRNLEFKLTKEQFHSIVQENCFYCDKEPSSKLKKHDQIFYYNGIDRVDNDKGYLITNCVPCCKSCNSKKKATSALMILRAYTFLFGEY